MADAMKGIEWRSDNAEAFLDEIPGACKDIDQVMEDARDLVTVDHTLRQILNVKGDWERARAVQLNRPAGPRR
nr:RtcB family protein [Pseudonocardia acidicola]